MKTKIVGTQFSKSKAVGMQKGSKVEVVHDETNEFDKMALVVYFNREQIGYIGRGTDVYDINRHLFPITGNIIDFHMKQEGDQFDKHDLGTLVSCNIQIPDQIRIDLKNNKKSFNEGLTINFNEDTHTYTFKGKVLVSATTFIKKYIRPFDSQQMIERCSYSWKIKNQDVSNAWDLGRDLAASFGTGVHKALEFEDLYRSFKKPDSQRCFTIKHPAIKRIVDDFFEFYNKLGFQGEIIPEALVSDVAKGICGLADRILVTSWEKKTCRIQDYKVNHSFDKKGQVSFTNLPDGLKLDTTKLSKLSLQLKFHATMLEKSGWTVEGVDGFVYSDKWEYYEANMLEGFDILKGTFNKPTEAIFN